ncbi:MAG TPA: S9 family peptidase [Candidatus Limnocylindria bacterium]|jgi:dipeptidyl aminopeptidase/acylaminoacyl peptidase|nr:S9 family peptidase [Candidatus Limnocylindria bacterium]
MNRALPSLLLAGAFLASAVPGAAADAQRPVVPEDLFKIAYVSNATISHDGKHVAFIVTRADLAKDTYLTNIWIADTDGARVAQLTRGDHDSEPAWSPDDRTLAFTAARGGPSQIFAIDLAGGEARQVTHQSEGASTAAWSHDGRRIAFTSTTTDPAPPSHVDWKALGVSAPPKYAKTDIRTIPWPRYEANGGGYVYNKHPHIWTIDANGANAKQITFGADGESGADWSPDDRAIAYSTVPLSDPEGDRSRIFVVPANGGKPVAFPTAHYSAFEQAWMREGRGLVYGFTSRHDASGEFALASANLDGTGERVAVPENTVAIGDAILNDTKEGGAGCGVLTSDGRTFIADVSVPGATQLDVFDMEGGPPTKLVGGKGEIQDCSVSRDARTIAYTALDATHLAEVYVYDRTTGKSHRLTHLNDALTDSLAIATPEAHTVSNGHGGTVAYWVLRPPNAVPGKRYPTVLNIHGGPQTEFGDAFFQEFQVLASRGYNVVYANPRGSVGYGYDWEEALLGDWGDAMFTDEMAVIDDVVKRPDVDPTRTFVTGGSYGGYATLWVVSHTNRFRAAMAERAVSDLFTETLSADFAAPLGFEGAAGTPHAWGPPLQAHATLWEQSPLAHVADVHTPLLLLHSDGDTRTPIDETLQEYEALKMLGRTVELVEVPRENHDLNRTGEPIHRVERLHLMEKWLERYTR